MIAFNALSQTTATGIALVIQTVYVVAVARSLSVAEFGQFSLVLAITQILFLSGDLGIHNTALRLIAMDREHSSATFQRFLFLKLWLSLFLLIVSALIALFLARERGPTLGYCMFWFGVGLSLQSLGMAFNIAFQAHNRLYLASLNVLTGVFLQAALGGVALWAGRGLDWLGGASAFSQGLAVTANLLLFRKIVHPVGAPRGEGTWSFAVHSIPVGIGTVLEAFTIRIGTILVTYLAGESATGIYSAATRIVGALRNLPSGIFSAVLPVMAAASGDPAAVRRVFRRYTAAALALAVLTVPPFWVGSDWLIGLLFKPEFAESAEVLRILTLSLPLLFLSGGVAHLLLSQRSMVARHPWVASCGTLASFVLFGAMVPRWGVTGAAWAQVGVEAVVLAAYLAGVRDYLRSRPVDLPPDPRAG